MLYSGNWPRHPADKRQSQEWVVTGDDLKEQVRSRTEIVDLIGKSLDLRRTGRGYVGLCPWHNDKKPSLQVNPDRQTWKCWVCDIGGDVFSFVMKRENCDFREALQMLAERAGISLGSQSLKKAVPGSPDDKSTLYQCCDWAAKQFHEFFLKADAAAAARQYVEERHISPTSIERFRIGFAPREWTWLLDRARNTAFTPEGAGSGGLGESGRPREPLRLVPRAGHVSHSRHAGAHDRLWRPHSAEPGRGRRRQVHQLARNAAVHQERHALCPGLGAMTASKSRQITVVEGYTDVILCHQHGVDDVVACCGTALGPAAHSAAQAVRRHGLSRPRRRRRRPAADERNPRAVRRGPDGPADHDAAGRARSGRLSG
jgi:DNA primase